MNTVKACASIFRMRVAEGLQYRMAALSGATIGVFWGLIEIIVYTVFFLHGDHAQDMINGMTLARAVSYVWIGQAMVTLQHGNVDGEILGKITNGDVGVELCRPIDLYAHWFAKTCSGRIAPFLIRGTIILVVGILMPASMGLSLPASLSGFLLFLLSLLCAILLGGAYTMLITAVRLNIAWGDGPAFMLFIISQVLSGAYFPLQLWPDFMQGFLLMQPFAGTLDIPARLYVGSMTAAEGVAGILLQLAWSGVFISLGRTIMGRKLHTVIIQGG